jgi:hypothetical protein
MLTLFYACAATGVAVTVLQLLLGLVADVHHGDVAGEHDGHADEGLNLLSVRSIAAGLAFFGIGGAGATAGGLGGAAAVALGAALGAGATWSVAALMRSFRRLEDDGTVRIEGAVGLPAQVYVPIPGGRSGAGKILMTLQSRTVELQAVTAEDALPTGADVTVVDVIGADTVEVVRTPVVLPELTA